MKLVKANWNTDSHALVLPNGNELYFSYATLVAAKIEGERFVNEDYLKYSRTTSRHLNYWLGDKYKAQALSMAEFKERIRFVA